MNIFGYAAPIILVIVSNTLYHLICKNTPSSVNPFAGLIVTYGTAFLGSIILMFITKKTTVYEEIQQLSITNLLMGFVIIGVEGGYMLMYQKGWEISKGSLIANISIAVILFFIGKMFFNESVSIQKILGIIACIIGIFLVNLG